MVVGFSDDEPESELDFNHSMEAAAWSDDQNIVELMLSHGANNYNETMDAAADYGYIEIVRLMLSHGAPDFNNAMEAAARRGHQNSRTNAIPWCQ